MTTARIPPATSRSGTSMTFSGLRSRWRICEPVRVLEAAADLKQQRDPLADRQRTLANLVLGQRLTREVRHHQVDEPLGRLAHVR